jgi:hypothetical protein
MKLARSFKRADRAENSRNDAAALGSAPASGAAGDALVAGLRGVAWRTKRLV